MYKSVVREYLTTNIIDYMCLHTYGLKNGQLSIYWRQKLNIIIFRSPDICFKITISGSAAYKVTNFKENLEDESTAEIYETFYKYDAKDAKKTRHSYIDAEILPLINRRIKHYFDIVKERNGIND